jgi:hypothetical protein
VLAKDFSAFQNFRQSFSGQTVGARFRHALQWFANVRGSTDAQILTPNGFRGTVNSNS